jgi:hypothetical protein
MLYSNGAYNNAAGTRDAFGRFSDQLVSEGFPEPRSISGDREHADQVKIFTDRYDQRASGSGLFNDVRYWDGDADGYPGIDRWVRVSPAGTVAPPGTGNHEARRSNDLAYPYNNLSTLAHKRAQQIAPNYRITCEGTNFREPWHWTHWGPLGAIGAPAVDNATPFPTPTIPQEDDNMLAIKLNVKGTHFLALGPGILRHWIASDRYEWAKNVIRADDNWTDVNSEGDFQNLLKTHGVDVTGTYRFAGGSLEVFEPGTGWRQGGLWSADNIIRDELKKLSS